MSVSLRIVPYDIMKNLASRCLPQRILVRTAGLVFFCLMMLCSCVPSAVITAKDKAALASGEKALVLLRIQCSVDNQPCEPFIKPSFTVEPIFVFGLGTFETVGEPKYAIHGFLSQEARQAGWIYFLLPPGIYYLAVLGPDSAVISKTDSTNDFRDAPRWRLDVLENTKLIYVGTLHFTGKTEGKLLFGGKVIYPVNTDEIPLQDEREPASHLLAEHFPNAGEVKTILLQRWRPGDSIIIRTPKRSKNE